MNVPYDSAIQAYPSTLILAGSAVLEAFVGVRRIARELVAAFAGVLALALVSGGCASAKGRADLLGFLEPGQSTREDVFVHLGEPSATYEDLRILIYRLDKDDAGYVLVEKRTSSWQGVRYNLVLVFDQQGVLQRHSLVTVRSP